jgi:hypothetical protein
MQRNLPPIGIRKRVSRKICSFGGDYLVDVDEGIKEEVRILNEELNVNTKASCEGHLPVKKVNSYIYGQISGRQRILLFEYMEDLGKKYEIEDNVRNYVFSENEYWLTFSLFDNFLRKHGNRFRINIGSCKPVRLQHKWDIIRRKGFKNAIRILKETFNQKPIVQKSIPANCQDNNESRETYP